MSSSGDPRFAQLAAQLATRGFQLTDIPSSTGTASAAGSKVIEVSANRSHAFDRPPFGTLEVQVPVSLRLKLDAAGNIASLSGGEPGRDDIQAAATWLDDLIADQQLDDPEGATRFPRATHTVQRQADGRRIVRRRHFNAAPGRTT